jgi:hypothetical protein
MVGRQVTKTDPGDAILVDPYSIVVPFPTERFVVSNVIQKTKNRTFKELSIDIKLNEIRLKLSLNFVDLTTFNYFH